MGNKTYQRVVDLLNEHIPGKISRNQFCRITGINRNSVDRYRAGLGCPGDETLERLAKYFGVYDIGWFKGEHDFGPMDSERIKEVAEIFIKQMRDILKMADHIPDDCQSTFRLLAAIKMLEIENAAKLFGDVNCDETTKAKIYKLISDTKSKIKK